MREIKFIGLDKISKEWVFGDLLHGVGAKHGNLYILPNKVNLVSVKNCDPLDGVEVASETVGQFTGLEDKNRKDIYEWDILKDTEGNIAIVVWIKEWSMFGCLFKDEWQKYITSGIGELDEFMFWTFPIENKVNEVIGNIHDNPELLK